MVELNYLMIFKEVLCWIWIYVGVMFLVDIMKVLWFMEIGWSVYDLVIYVLEVDFVCVFESIEKFIYCLIKGDVSYVGLDGEELGWVYKMLFVMV